MHTEGTATTVKLTLACFPTDTLSKVNLRGQHKARYPNCFGVYLITLFFWGVGDGLMSVCGLF